MQGEIQQKLGRPNQRVYKVVQRLKNFLEQNKQIEAGTGVKQNNYLQDNEGKKYYTDKEKCDIMKATWDNIYSE